ncbi:MAG: hypothetical protein J7M38_05010 [Armatimonadetes bacterium]|nr:hypothetical protein [Armatimonadota bacterium]
MLEFKKEYETGEYYLIEVNPKFWGSLDLAVESGVDFPGYIYDYYILGKKPNFKGYRNICFTWLTGLIRYININKH